MRSELLARTGLIIGVAVLGMAAGIGAQELSLDGVPYGGDLRQLPAEGSAAPAGELSPVIDVVGGTGLDGWGTGRAKGNAYRVDLRTGLVEAEFWLDVTGDQTLAFSVHESPVESGTYSQVFETSRTVTGSGVGWYSSGPIGIPLQTGRYYIIAVSWSGTTSYWYDVADSQAVSFGAYVHGYPSGFHPLPTVITSTGNDQAVYYQRLTTDVDAVTDTIFFDGFEDGDTGAWSSAVP